MLKTGLVSVSFRQLACTEIIKKAKQSKLTHIEWGSDIHVPQNDIENAKRVSCLTEENGLSVSSYGSYYRLGQGDDFTLYLETARILKAPIIRIWAGTQGSGKVTAPKRKALVNEAKDIAKMAAEYGINVDFEYHPDTLTDHHVSARKLIEEVNEPNCRIYWQPNFTLSQKENLDAVADILEYIDVIHVFFWKPDYKRRMLSEGKEIWSEYLSITKKAKNIKYLLEFVKNDDPDILSQEADTLHNLLKGSNIL